MTGRLPLFDAYLMVDWSANGTPKTGADSIWYAEYRREGRRLVRRALANPPTRAAACAAVADRLAALAASGRRVLAGFDFPFGYPAGTAHALGLDGMPWQDMWRLLADGIEDAESNANNRFALGERLNRRISGGSFPFWGHPPRQARRHLKPRKPRRHRAGEPAERRLCERRAPRAQPVWKLAYTGSVGSQALTGIPRVRQLRHDPRLVGVSRIWPFETGLGDEGAAQIVLAEVYPSLFGADRIEGLPKDAGQVTAAARGLAHCDWEGRLAGLMAGDPALGEDERIAVESEEAWILGITKGPAV
ncbi:MAG: hypothetical protein JSU82_11250 [Rhodospirillales bacterium]|nr:MAG: hypothetical protein JSU82_11250 [Rhodospirillales bacterium]